MSFIDISVTSFLFLPLLSFLILIFFGNKIKEKSHFVALPLIGITLLNALSGLISAIHVLKPDSKVRNQYSTAIPVIRGATVKK